MSWLWRTRACSTIYCSQPAHKRCWKSHSIPTPRSRDRCHRHPAHLGAEPAPASPHSLCHSCGRALTRSSSMGSSPLSFLLTRQSSESYLSWQVPRRPETPPPQQEAAVRGSGSCDCGSTAVRKVSPPTASPRLGGLCQACLRRSHAGVALFRSLHPSRSDFQSSIVSL